MINWNVMEQKKPAPTRAQIQRLIRAKNKEMQKLSDEILKLRKQHLTTSDRNHVFHEGTQVVVVRKKPLTKKKVRIGTITWKEKFIDDDTGKSMGIVRSMVVKKDGEFIDHPTNFPRKTYFS